MPKQAEARQSPEHACSQALNDHLRHHVDKPDQAAADNTASSLLNQLVGKDSLPSIETALLYDTFKIAAGDNETTERGKIAFLKALGLPLPKAGALSIDPQSDLNAKGTKGGPFNPTSKQYVVKNTGDMSVHWNASKGKNWVTLSESQGILVLGASTKVTVSINKEANKLNATDQDEVTFTYPGGSIQTHVHLTVS